MRRALPQACRLSLTPSSPLPSLSESSPEVAHNPFLRRDRCSCSPDPYMLGRSMGPVELLVGNTGCLSECSLSNSCPNSSGLSGKVDKLRDLSRTTASTATFLRPLAAPVDLQKSQWRSPVGLKQHPRPCGCTARPKAVCPHVRPRVRRSPTGR